MRSLHLNDTKMPTLTINKTNSALAATYSNFSRVLMLYPAPLKSQGKCLSRTLLLARKYSHFEIETDDI